MSEKENKNKIFFFGIVFSFALISIAFGLRMNNERNDLRSSLNYYKGKTRDLENQNTKLSENVSKLEKENEYLEKSSTNNTCDESDYGSELEDVFGRVKTVRGLSGSFPKNVEFMTKKEVSEYIESYESTESESELQKEEKILKILGLIPSNLDLESFMASVYEEQIGGFYDTQNRNLVIVSDSPEKYTLSKMDEFILSHELTHNLQHQNFDIVEKIDSCENDREKDDESLAYLSLIEGDATLLMSEYLSQMDLKDQLEIGGASLQLRSDTLDSSPQFIQETVLFPYDYGLKFVEYFYKDKSWDAINRLYEVPPISTEQIMHPEKYLNFDYPQKVEINEQDRIGRDQADSEYSTVFGEFGYKLFFDEYLSDRESSICAEGWKGDLLKYYNGSDEDEVLLKSYWDTENDASESIECFENIKNIIGSGSDTEVKVIIDNQDGSVLVSFINFNNF